MRENKQTKNNKFFGVFLTGTQSTCFPKIYVQPITTYLLSNLTDLADTGTRSNGSISLFTDAGTSWTTITWTETGTTPLWFNASKKSYAVLPAWVDFRSIQLSSGVTLVTWFRMDRDTGLFGRLFDFNNGDETNGKAAFWTVSRTGNENRLRCAISVAGLPFVYCDMNVYAVDGKWHQLAWSVSSSGQWSVYLDFLLVSTCNMVSNLPVIDYSVRRYWLGRSIYAANGWASMALYDFRIYGTVLTKTQIVYEQGSGLKLGAFDVSYDPFGVTEGGGANWTCAPVMAGIDVAITGTTVVYAFNLQVKGWRRGQRFFLYFIFKTHKSSQGCVCV